MSWTCDYCGTENQYNETLKETVCHTCGMEATEINIRDAEISLSAYKKAQLRKIREVAVQKKKAARNALVQKWMNAFKTAISAMPLVNLLLVAVAFVLIGIGAFRELGGISDDIDSFASNLRLYADSTVWDQLSNNLSDNFANAFEAQLSVMAGNIKEQGPNNFVNLGNNFANNLSSDNRQPESNRTDNLEYIQEIQEAHIDNIRVNGRDRLNQLSLTLKYYQRNLVRLWDNITLTVDELINQLKKES